MEQKVEHMTTSQVAKRFGVDSSTVRRWVLTDKIKPEVTTPGGHYRFSPESIEQLATAGAPTK